MNDRFSKYARFLFNFLTNWNYNASKSYCDYKQYKVIGLDPKDEVIPFMASLFIGIAKIVFLKEFA